MKSVFATLLLVTVFVAYSKKSADSLRSFGIEGTWEGQISTTPAGPGGQFKFRVYPDGTAERINRNDMITASGNWELSGRRFTATYNYSNGTIVIVHAIFDSEAGKLTGVWENNGNDNGHLSVAKR